MGSSLFASQSELIHISERVEAALQLPDSRTTKPIQGQGGQFIIAPRFHRQSGRARRSARK